MLLRAVSTAMSQAGMAHVECSGPPGQKQVVSGGDQITRYALQAGEDGVWDVAMVVLKSDFEYFIDEAGEMQACGPGSYLRKGCTVRFRAPVMDRGVEADVLEVYRQTVILDDRSRPLAGPWTTTHDQGPAAARQRAREVACGRGPWSVAANSKTASFAELSKKVSRRMTSQIIPQIDEDDTKVNGTDIASQGKKVN